MSRPVRTAVALAAAAALALAPGVTGAASAAPAAPRGLFTWTVYWSQGLPSSFGPGGAPALSGRVAYSDSNSGVTATVSVTGDDGLPAACVSHATITLPHGSSGPGVLRRDGSFDGLDPGTVCNGRYTATLHGRTGFGPAPRAPKVDFTYQHPLAPVPDGLDVAASSDGTALVVSWPAVANPTPDFVGYEVTSTYRASEDADAVTATHEVAADATSFHQAIDGHYGGYQFTVAARYWGTGGPDAAPLSSAPSEAGQATVSPPGSDSTVPVQPGGPGGQPGGGGSPGGGSTGGGTPSGGSTTPVIRTGSGAAKSFFPLPNLPRSETPNVATPADGTSPTSTTTAPSTEHPYLPEPGEPEAVTPKHPLRSTAVVDQPTGGGLNGRTIAVVVAAVLVLVLIAAQLALVSRRAAQLELEADETGPASGL